MPSVVRLAISAVSLALVAVLSLAACSGGGAGDPDVDANRGHGADAAFPVTIDHYFGTTEIQERPERIVALGSGTDGEILYALGIEPVGLASFEGFGAANDDGVMPWVEPHINPEVTTLLPGGAEGVEAVAALDPDLILVTYGYLEEKVYDQLSSIAPTVASPGGQWELDWRLDLRTVARAVGMTEQAQQLEGELTRGIEEAAAAHPELAGVDYSYLEIHQEGIWVYLSADPRNQLIAELGLVASEGVRALDEDTGGEFVADLSFELAADVDADLLLAYTNVGDAESVLTAPIFRDLRAVRAGRIAAYGAEDIVFLASLQPSPLTIPIAVPQLAADLAAAL